MKRSSITSLTAGAMTAALALAACGGSSRPGPQQSSAGYNAALNAVVNPSSHAGGTITFDNSSTPDSTDPGNTYISFQWDMLRLYGRSLVTYRSAPGAAGMQLVPDLASSLGLVGGGGLTWTYRLKPGIRFEDGSTVTSTDVKYAVERSYARDVLPN